MEDKQENSTEQIQQKPDAESSNDAANEMLQKEKLIDPGNEHSHHADEQETLDKKEARFYAQPEDTNTKPAAERK